MDPVNYPDSPGIEGTSPPQSPAIEHPSATSNQPPQQDLSETMILSKLPEMYKLTVTEPQAKTDGSKTQHVTFLITSQETSSAPKQQVRRRFAQFNWLYQQLLQSFPSCIIPPLPDKNRMEYLTGGRFSPEFTIRRAISLERFLIRISHHPLLHKCELFQNFINPEIGIASAHYSLPKAENFNSVSKSAFSAMDQISDTLMNAFTKVHNQTEEMAEAKANAVKLERSINSLEKNSQMATKNNRGIALELKKVHHYSSELSKSQKGDSIEYNSLANTAKLINAAVNELVRGSEGEYYTLLQDMSHYVYSLKYMLKQRDQRQIDYEVLTDYLKRTESELEGLQSGNRVHAFSPAFLKNKVSEIAGYNSNSREWASEQIDHLKEKISTLKSECSLAKQASERFEDFAKNEIRIFEAILSMELRQCLNSYIDMHIDYYNRLLDELE